MNKSSSNSYKSPFEPTNSMSLQKTNIKLKNNTTAIALNQKYLSATSGLWSWNILWQGDVFDKKIIN